VTGTERDSLITVSGVNGAVVNETRARLATMPGLEQVLLTADSPRLSFNLDPSLVLGGVDTLVSIVGLIVALTDRRHRSRVGARAKPDPKDEIDEQIAKALRQLRSESGPELVIQEPRYDQDGECIEIVVINNSEHIVIVWENALSAPPSIWQVHVHPTSGYASV